MRAYERLIEYAKVSTASAEGAAGTPSTARQFDLAKKLAAELEALGAEGVFVDEHAYVYGRLPATPGLERVPCVALLAHLDTVPEFPGENVRPRLVENYDGGDVPLGERPRPEPEKVPAPQAARRAHARGDGRHDALGRGRQGRHRGNHDGGRAPAERTAPARSRGGVFPAGRRNRPRRGAARPRAPRRGARLHARRRRAGRSRLRKLQRRRGRGPLFRRERPPRHGQGHDGQRLAGRDGIPRDAPRGRDAARHRGPRRVLPPPRNGRRRRIGAPSARAKRASNTPPNCSTSATARGRSGSRCATNTATCGRSSKRARRSSRPRSPRRAPAASSPS